MGANAKLTPPVSEMLLPVRSRPLLLHQSVTTLFLTALLMTASPSKLEEPAIPRGSHRTGQDSGIGVLKYARIIYIGRVNRIFNLVRRCAQKALSGTRVHS